MDVLASAAANPTYKHEGFRSAVVNMQFHHFKLIKFLKKIHVEPNNEALWKGDSF